MYLRTTSRSNRNGSRVKYFQLAHNFRDPETGSIKAQVVHNFGRADQLDREQLVRLCRSIARVCDLEVRDPLELGIDESDSADDGVLAPGVRQIGTKPLGPCWVIEALWERLEIGAVLRDIQRREKCTVPYERALLAMTANRLCEPTSKLGVWDRWLDEVHLPSCQGLKLAQMYEAMDLLHRHAEEVERAVFFKTADLFNLEVDLIYYDTTTCSFSIDQSDDDDDAALRQFGHAKEGGWAPQVIVALAVTKQGLPVRSWVFPGNTSDVATVAKVKEDLKGWKLGRALFVGDSGMNSEENRRMLARSCGTYVLAVRAGSVSEVQDEVLCRPGRYRELSDNLRAKEVVVGDGERRRRYILCLNPKEAQRQSLHRSQVLAEIEDELSRHQSRKASAKWAIELMASKRWGRYLKVGRGNKVVIDREKVRKAERMDGKWVLITNDDTLSLDDAAAAYKNLMVIERCFRTLKRTELSMSPMYHWLPRRIETHVKLCVLGLLLERIVEMEVGRPWWRVRKALERLQATEYQSESHRFFRRNEMPSETASILKMLDISKPKPVLAVEDLSSDL